MIVNAVEALNPMIQRISTEDAQFDIPSGLIDFVPGDVARLDIMSCERARESNATCVMNGLVYHRDASRACISCGGLLVSVKDTSTPVDANVQVHVSKSRRRRQRSDDELDTR